MDHYENVWAHNRLEEKFTTHTFDIYFVSRIDF